MLYQQKYPTNDWSNVDTVIENSKLNLLELQEIDKKQKAKGKIVFRYFDVPVADGKAFYQVIKVTKTKAVVKLCSGICLDDYMDMILGEGGEIPLSVANDLIGRMDAIRKLFKIDY